MTYAVAEPDNEYIVKVIVHRNSLNKFIADHIRIGIYVDGTDCNYWKRIDTDSVKATDSATCTTFKGFKIGAEDMRAFVFASPTVRDNSSSGSSTSDTLSAGTIRVDAFECVCDEGVFMNRSKTYTAPSGSQVTPDSKFYQQPSVTTKGGRNVNRLEKFEPLARWKNKSELCSFVLHYHAKDVIDFLVDARANNIDLDTRHTGGHKRSLLQLASSSSGVMDLTGDADDDEGGDRGACKRARPQQQQQQIDNHRLQDKSKHDNGSINEYDDDKDKGANNNNNNNNFDDDEEIQHIVMVKHIPCFDISQGTKKEKVSYIRKEC
jgi:hypothetical protein